MALFSEGETFREVDERALPESLREGNRDSGE
jgi:hypothetical protein